MYIHTALYSEAKPIIEFYKLKEVNDRYFKIYRNEKYILIISGIGKILSAAALSHLFTRFENFSDKLISIGIAGSTKNLPIAEIVNVSKIVDKDNDAVFFLDKIDKFKNLSVTTSSKPLYSAKTDLGDMEASAVYKICKIYNKKCKILKVVSDYFEPQDVDIENVYKLISININKIAYVLSIN